MENTHEGLAKLNVPIGFSDTTGMNVYQSYTANSGLNYIVGMREMQDLLIVEQIAEGTACTFLCGILIYHKGTKTLLKEIEIDRNIHYSREKVMVIVQKALIQVLGNACGNDNTKIDLQSANEFLSEALEKCYFENSRKTIIDWAKSVGIIKN